MHLKHLSSEKTKYPTILLDFIKNKSIATGICVLDDYKYGKVPIEKIFQIYKFHFRNRKLFQIFAFGLSEN